MGVQSKRFALAFRNTLNTWTVVPLPFFYEAWSFYLISLGIEKFWGTCLMKSLPALLSSRRLTNEHNASDVSGASSAYCRGFRFTIWDNATSLPLHLCPAFLTVNMICCFAGSNRYTWQLNKIYVTSLFVLHLKIIWSYNTSHPLYLFSSASLSNPSGHGTAGKLACTFE